MAHRAVGGVLALTLVLFALPRAGGAASRVPAQPRRVDIRVELAPDGSSLRGRARWTVHNDTAKPLERLPFWLYPNRFQGDEGRLSDRVAPWIYPAGPSGGAMRIVGAFTGGAKEPLESVAYAPFPSPAASVEGVAGVAWVRLGAPVPVNGAVCVELDFEVDIPERRGRFGRYGGVVSLGGGFFPRPMADLTGSDPARPFRAVLMKIEVGFPENTGGVVGDVVVPPAPKAQTAVVGPFRAVTLGLVAMNRMDVSELVASWGRAVFVSNRLLEPDEDSNWRAGRDSEGVLPDGVPEIAENHPARRCLEVAIKTGSLLAERVGEAGRDRRVVIVELPLWDRLVQEGPGAVWVSDRIYRVFPAERALWFHDLALARAVAADLVWDPLIRAGHGGAAPLEADLVGAWIAKAYREEVHRKEQSMEDLVGFAGFVPLIDNLLYAPQVPFRQVYAPGIEERDDLRDEPWRFADSSPRGERILAKLEDRLGFEAAHDLIAAIVREPVELSTGLRRALGDEAESFEADWFGEYPRVNYVLSSVTDRKTDRGYLHLARIEREGQDVVEPVTVRFIDEDGRAEDVVWDGRDKEGSVSWESPAPIDKVAVDPGMRLIEDRSLSDGHPLSDNTSGLSWRPPLLTRLLIWGDLTGGVPNFDAGFAMRRRYDVTNSFHGSVGYTTRGYGGGVAYYRHFGATRTLNSRTWFAGPSLYVNRYEPIEDAGPELPEATRFGATTGSLALSLGRDDREYFWDPRSGTAFSVAALYGLGRDDDGRIVQVGKLLARGFGLWSPRLGHTLALYGGVMGLVGHPNAANLNTLSERSLLRGFDPNETFGRTGIYGVCEYRHTLFDASRISMPLSTLVQRFQGVLFAGGGTMSLPTGYEGMFEPDRIFTEVGYGLRLHALIFGVQQYLLGLDLAVPLTPVNRYYEAEVDGGSSVRVQRPAYKLVFGITQVY